MAAASTSADLQVSPVKPVVPLISANRCTVRITLDELQAVGPDELDGHEVGIGRPECMTGSTVKIVSSTSYSSLHIFIVIIPSPSTNTTETISNKPSTTAHGYSGKGDQRAAFHEQPDSAIYAGLLP